MNRNGVLGLSLLELLLVIVIIGALAGLAAPWLVQLTEGYRTGSESQTARNQAMTALERLQIAVRQADDITQVDDQELVLMDRNGDVIAWTINGDTLQRQVADDEPVPMLRGLGPDSVFGTETAVDTTVVTFTLQFKSGPPIPTVAAYNRRGLP